MATYPQKFTIEDGSDKYECDIYTTAEEATPEGGRALLVGVNYGANQGYLGLIPVAIAPSGTPPLKVNVEGVDYFFMESVAVYVTLTIKPSEHQTIKFICNGITELINSDTGAKTFILPVGASYSISVIPDDNYTAGTIQGIASSGYITTSMKNINITASNAEVIVPPVPETVYITITQPTGASVSVTVGGLSHTSSFQANGNDVATFVINYEDGYEGGTVLVNGSTAPSSLTLTGDVTITVSGVSLKKHTITLVQGEHVSSVVMKCNGTTIESGGTVSHGATLEVTAYAEDGYDEPTITFS